MKFFATLTITVMAILCGTAYPSAAKEIALTFDDAPVGDTPHSKSAARTDELIRQLRELKVPEVMIFANPCKSSGAVAQLRRYVEAGHRIANHTCSHPRLDEVGPEAYERDIAKADALLAPLLKGPKFFRYPYLNEGRDPAVRDRVRSWLRSREYRHGMVSVDNDDYIFSFKINQAKERGKDIDYKAVEELFLSHLLGAVEFYDALAVTTLGRSPRHVLLLHETDATVRYLGPFVRALRARDWEIIPASRAFEDPLYSEAPENTYGNNGIISQIDYEKSGVKKGYFTFEEVVAALNRILGL